MPQARYDEGASKEEAWDAAGKACDDRGLTRGGGGAIFPQVSNAEITLGV